MVNWLFFLFFLQNVSAFEPPCTSCKYYIPNKDNLDKGLCKMFINMAESNDNRVFNNYAVHCRNNEDLCDKSGFLYDEKDFNNDLIQEYDNLKNRCCGEVNESDELEQLEREFFQVYQEMKKYNTKQIYKYKTSYELYKLFKKSKM